MVLQVGIGLDGMIHDSVAFYTALWNGRGIVWRDRITLDCDNTRSSYTMICLKA